MYLLSLSVSLILAWAIYWLWSDGDDAVYLRWFSIWFLSLFVDKILLIATSLDISCGLRLIIHSLRLIKSIILYVSIQRFRGRKIRDPILITLIIVHYLGMFGYFINSYVFVLFKYGASFITYSLFAILFLKAQHIMRNSRYIMSFINIFAAFMQFIPINLQEFISMMTVLELLNGLSLIGIRFKEVQEENRCYLSQEATKRKLNLLESNLLKLMTVLQEEVS